MTHYSIVLLLAAVAGAPAGAQELSYRSVGVVTPRSAAPPAWSQQDPADPLYRQARSHMNSGRYREAAETFARIIREYPRSEYTPDSYYYQAFSLYKAGGEANLTAAVQLLEQQKQRHANATTHDDAESLRVRINGELARSGNAVAAVNVVTAANAAGQQACPTDDDDDIRTSALNALMQMDDEMAMPIIKQVLARKDACNAPLRRKAMFIVSQMRKSSEKEGILLDVAKNDADREVRKQAVFWLSQVNTESAVSAIEQVLNTSSDFETRKQAIFALSQNRSPRASQILRTWAERTDGPIELRGDAIFWLGQRSAPENGTYLRTLYPKLREPELKEKVLFSISQRREPENGRWLMDIALDQNENIEVRKKALFWAGQMRATPVADLIALWGRTTDLELREHLIFVYSQRREREVIDKMIDIARNEKDRELRKKAIFWLGQSKDPRVAQILLELIGGDNR